jgi:small nuclear ribonucleoprotein (snRNP)-like protein
MLFIWFLITLLSGDFLIFLLMVQGGSGVSMELFTVPVEVRCNKNSTFLGILESWSPSGNLVLTEYKNEYSYTTIGLRWSTEIWPKSFFGSHLTSWSGFESRDGKFLFLLFYLIWLSLSPESSQFKNFAKILKTLWENIIFSKKHVIIKKTTYYFSKIFVLGWFWAQAESNKIKK